MSNRKHKIVEDRKPGIPLWAILIGILGFGIGSIVVDEPPAQGQASWTVSQYESEMNDRWDEIDCPGKMSQVIRLTDDGIGWTRACTYTGEVVSMSCEYEGACIDTGKGVTR